MANTQWRCVACDHVEEETAFLAAGKRKFPSHNCHVCPECDSEDVFSIDDEGWEQNVETTCQVLDPED